MTGDLFDTGRFFQIVDDPDQFDFRGYNLFKVFYFAFARRRIEESSSLKAGPRKDLRWALLRSLGFIRSMAVVVYLGLLNRRGSPRILLYRGKKSSFFSRLVEYKGCDRFIIVKDYGDGVNDKVPRRYRPDLYLHDFAIPIGLLYGLVRVFLARDLQQYAQKIVGKYPELGFSIAEIIGKVVLFYAKFLTYRFLLTLLVPEKVILISHYGKEAFIAACKHKHIQVIELMHGHLTAHPQYNFPRSYQHLFHRALFPDRLSVFGEYWKQVAVQGNMFPESAILIGGYHLELPDGVVDDSSSPIPQDKAVIMISGQGIMLRELRDYISFLKSELDRSQWHIVIKPHPREDPTTYDTVLEPGFVTLTHQNPYELLSRVDIHISFYSTLLYEALRYNVSNYVLLVDGAPDICYAIIDSGAALPLRPNQRPEPGKGLGADTQFYFADFNPAVLFEDEPERVHNCENLDTRKTAG